MKNEEDTVYHLLKGGKGVKTRFGRKKKIKGFVPTTLRIGWQVSI